MKPGDRIVPICPTCREHLVMRALILTCPKCGKAPDRIDTKTIGRSPGWGN